MGSGSRDVDAWHANGSDAEDRGLQVPMALEHGPVTSSGKAAPGPDPRIRHRTQIGMFRPIRMDHTNCLQVAIKTLQFNSIQFRYVIGIISTDVFYGVFIGILSVFYRYLIDIVSVLYRHRYFSGISSAFPWYVIGIQSVLYRYLIGI